MKWYKIASGLTIYSNGGSTRSWPLAVQDYGLTIKDAVYGIFIISRTANAKIGAEHREGPTADSNFHSLYATILAVAAPPAASTLVRANTNAAVLGPLMPFSRR